MTSDDDYIDPYLGKQSESEQEFKASSSEGKLSDSKPKKEHKKTSSTSSSSSVAKLLQELPTKNTESAIPLETCPTDMSDSTDSESSKKMDFVNNAECNSMHEGRQLVHTILPINIETVFGLMFQKSRFFTEFHNMRKTTDLNQGEWEDMPDGTKKRVISLTVAITQGE